MNERAREVLVRAALDGVTQIRDRTRDEHGGRCAAGVLLEHATGRPLWGGVDPVRVWKTFGMTATEWTEMIRLNNAGVDFLTIARKFGEVAS